MRARRIDRIVLGVGAAASLALFLPLNLSGQCGKPPGGPISANPNRPTVADPADITQYGVLEMEYGWERVWRARATRESNFGGLLKFAALCDLEIRWQPDTFLEQTTGAARERGIGDNRIGSQYRFRRQSPRAPTLSLSYMLKIPSASVEKGLGSGRMDHQFKFLASKDIRGVHFDFNASYLLVGREATPGFDKNAELNLSFSHRVKGKLGFTGEIYGDTRLDSVTPGFVSTLGALTYNITPRWVIDSGMDFGLTSGSPHRKRLVMGFVYSLADLYPRRRQRSKVN